MICAKFGWIGQVVLVVLVFSLCCHFLGTGWGFHLNTSDGFFFCYVQMKWWKCEMFTDGQTGMQDVYTWEGKKISLEHSAIERHDNEKWNSVEYYAF